jgi:PAS domain S-box-containing protein
MDKGGDYEALLAATQDIVVVMDENGVIEYVNPAADRVAGYGASDLVGESAFNNIPETDRQTAFETFREVVEGPPGTARSLEHRYRTADGSVIWLESRLANNPDADLSGYVVTARNVTERKRAEQKRRETASKLRRITENTSNVLWMFDSTFSELEFVNSEYESVWGRSAAKMEDSPLDFLRGVHPDDRENAKLGIGRLVEGESVDMELRVNAEKGYGRWVRLRGFPVVESGEFVCNVVAAHDVTKRRERERQVQAMDNVLRHNLRNDLTVIMGHANRLEEESDLGEPAEQYLQCILDQCDSLLETADKGRQIVGLLGPDDDVHQVDLASEVRQAAVSVAEDSSVSIAVDTPETAMAECVSQTPLLVKELLDNAVTHADGTANVDLRVERTADHVELIVVDDGPLIPEADRQAIEGDADITQLEHGSGLGLWLVAWIVRCSGGSISFDAHEGGNRVTARFMRSA